MGIWYCTREDILASQKEFSSGLDYQLIDRAIESASRSIEDSTLHRKFYPEIDTRYFPWPDSQHGTSFRLWLEEDELISVTTLTAGGTVISSSDYFLEPVNEGPPYDRVEIDLDSNSDFGSSDTHQRAISIVGMFGYDNATEPAGTLDAAINDSVTSLNVSNSAMVGVGSIILLGTERLIVTNKTLLDTTQNLQSDMTAAKNNVTVAVTDGTAFSVGEVILLNAEKMLITDIAGNNLIVQRAYLGSVLATHSASDIYAYRTCTVTRGALGTTAASHLDNATISKQVIQPLVRDLCIAETINRSQQESAAYARTIGSGESQRESSGKGLGDIRRQAKAAHKRYLMGAV